MKALYSGFGRPFAWALSALVAAWILGLVLLPQASLLARAFQVEDRGGEAARLALEIDRLYVRRIELDREITNAAREPAEEAPPEAALQDPFAAPTPIARETRRVPALQDPFAAAAPAPIDEGEDRRARLGALETERAALVERIGTLEAEAGGGRDVDVRWSLGNFTSMSSLHAGIFAATLFYALCTTLLALALAYPVAWAVASSRRPGRAALMLLCLVVPYAINELLRIFAWVMILETRGLLNAALDALGLIDLAAGEGVRWVASNGAVFAVVVYTYLLFMVFPIYNALETLDRNQVDAATDLGASPWRIHARVIAPHAKPGIAVGCIMTFMLSAGSIAVPEIVGRGMHPDWFSQVISRRFFEADAWNQGAAYATALLVACLAFILVVMRLFGVGIRDIAR